MGPAPAVQNGIGSGQSISTLPFAWLEMDRLEAASAVPPDVEDLQLQTGLKFENVRSVTPTCGTVSRARPTIRIDGPRPLLLAFDADDLAVVPMAVGDATERLDLQ